MHQTIFQLQRFVLLNNHKYNCNIIKSFLSVLELFSYKDISLISFILLLLVVYFSISQAYHFVSVVYVKLRFDIYLVHKHYTKYNLLQIPCFFVDAVSILSILHSCDQCHTIILSTIYVFICLFRDKRVCTLNTSLYRYSHSILKKTLLFCDNCACPISLTTGEAAL